MWGRSGAVGGRRSGTVTVTAPDRSTAPAPPRRWHLSGMLGLQRKFLLSFHKDIYEGKSKEASFFQSEVTRVVLGEGEISGVC